MKTTRIAIALFVLLFTIEFTIDAFASHRNGPPRPAKYNSLDACVYDHEDDQCFVVWHREHAISRSRYCELVEYRDETHCVDLEPPDFRRDARSATAQRLREIDQDHAEDDAAEVRAARTSEGALDTERSDADLANAAAIVEEVEYYINLRNTGKKKCEFTPNGKPAQPDRVFIEPGKERTYGVGHDVQMEIRARVPYNNQGKLSVTVDWVSVEVKDLGTESDYVLEDGSIVTAHNFEITGKVIK